MFGFFHRLLLSGSRDVEPDDEVLAGGDGFEQPSAPLMRQRDDEDVMMIINAFLFMKDQERQ